MEHRRRQAREEGVSQPDTVRCLLGRGQPLSLRLESDALQGGLAASLPLQSNPNRKGFSALRHRKEVTTGEGRKEVRSEGADKNGVGAGNGPPSLPG